MAGEMHPSELQPGGDWYEAGQSLLQAAQALCRRTGWKLKGPELRPFDQYCGPYVRFGTGGGRLWFPHEQPYGHLTNNLDLDEFVLEHSYVGGTLRGTVRELAEAFKTRGSKVRLYDTGIWETLEKHGPGYIQAFSGGRAYVDRPEIHESWEVAQSWVLIRLEREIATLQEEMERVRSLTPETCPEGTNPYE